MPGAPCPRFTLLRSVPQPGCPQRPAPGIRRALRRSSREETTFWGCGLALQLGADWSRHRARRPGIGSRAQFTRFVADKPPFRSRTPSQPERPLKGNGGELRSASSRRQRGAGSHGPPPPLFLMSCTRMIQVLDPRPLTNSVMPVDVAMRLCLAHSPPLKTFLGPYNNFQRRNFVTKLKPLKPCLNLKAESKSQKEWKSSHNQAKKRVVFADSKGLSLTAIRVFSDLPEEPAWDLQFDLLDLNDISSGLKLHEEKNLILDFPQPSTDYLSFRNNFQKNFVCLENCSLQERTVTGTVKVKNMSFEKRVQVRITFDSWKSYTNVDCVYMKNVYDSSDSDTFSFTIDLPPVIPTEEKIEFCISYYANGQVFWDNNEGQNYRIVHVQWKPDGVRAHTARQDCAFHHVPPKTELESTIFGSPRLASGLFPEWQSWGRMENLASYR